MEGEHGGGASSTPERRESLHINSVVIPADEDQPLRQSELMSEWLKDGRQLVGGPVQAIDLSGPPARLYCNEEGKLMRLQPNRRATLLLWVHNPPLRYKDIVVGDAFIVGPQRGLDRDADVPDDYVQALFNASRFRVELRSRGQSEWHLHPEHFDDWVTAYEHAVSWSEGALRLHGRQMDSRVVPDE